MFTDILRNMIVSNVLHLTINCDVIFTAWSVISIGVFVKVLGPDVNVPVSTLVKIAFSGMLPPPLELIVSLVIVILSPAINTFCLLV